MGENKHFYLRHLLNHICQFYLLIHQGMLNLTTKVRYLIFGGVANLGKHG